MKKISRWKAHTNTWKLNWNISTITDTVLDQKRVNVCEHTVKTGPHDRFGKVPPEWMRGRMGGGDRGKIEWKSSEVNTRWFPFNFPSIPFTPSPFLSCTYSRGTFPKLSCDAVFTVCSHTFTLFWSRKTSMITKTFQLSFCVCVFHLAISSFFR